MKFCLAILNNVQYNSRTMNNKETIIEETTKLIETYQGDISKITIREISGRIHISVGLINYHFDNKQKLIETCVQRIIAGIVKTYRPVVIPDSSMNENEAFLYRSETIMREVFSYLFSHPSISKVSILSDYRSYDDASNSASCVRAFSYILKEKFDEEKAMRLSFYLVSAMQVAFVKSLTQKQFLDYDFTVEEERNRYLHDLVMTVLGENLK